LSIIAMPSEDRDRRDAPVTVRYRYIVYGVVVESSFLLKAIDEAPDADVAAAVSIDLGPPAYFQERLRNVAAVDDWLNHTVLRGGDVYMRVDGLFEAVVGSDGRHVVCARLAGAEDKSFEANMLNFVLSTSLTLRGEEPLHATVVDLDGRSVGLLGPSGAGKSTLAAFLITQGGKLITDDVLRLTFVDGRAYAHAGPQRLKLVDGTAERFLPNAVGDGYWNSMTGKIMVQPHAPSPGRHTPKPLSALFWLGDPEPLPGVVAATRLAGIDLARALTASAMNIRYYAPERLTRQLQFAERVARTVPVHALHYARSYPLLDRVAAEIRRLAGP
jgi:hypothetical protein